MANIWVNGFGPVMPLLHSEVFIFHKEVDRPQEIKRIKRRASAKLGCLIKNPKSSHPQKHYFTFN
jgi:hypothetical protein